MTLHDDFVARMTRRELFERSAAVAALLLVSPASLHASPSHALRRTVTPDRPYLDAAVKAERWIRRAKLSDARGASWLANPEIPSPVTTDVYSGTAGIVLFYLELYHATRDAQYLTEAVAGARYLAATLPKTTAELGAEGAGLYTGLAGVAYTLERVAIAARNGEHRIAARTAMALLHAAEAERTDKGGWNDSNDIISGTAGIALTMIWADRNLSDNAALAAAARAGEQLLAVGQPQPIGTKWEISAGAPRQYPNFSHGTAGVAYCLATLYGAINVAKYKTAAISGATYLQAIAEKTASGGQRIRHSEPGGEQLFYMSWCHGPAGTARLFHQLTEMTGDPQWKAYSESLAAAIIDSGVPEAHPDRSGFWNNVSQCCGNCGVTEFFLAHARTTSSQAHLDFAFRVMKNTLSRAAIDGDGLKWPQAENRTSPDAIVAQTGYMQGAAGVGMSLLHVDGVFQRRRPFVVLPDSPAW